MLCYIIISDNFDSVHEKEYTKYKILTLNLKSPVGGSAYGIPRKFAIDLLYMVLLHLPRISPHFVLTSG